MSEGVRWGMGTPDSRSAACISAMVTRRMVVV
jgi:hypothetical protein